MKKVNIYGRENVNWSIDKDIQFLEEVFTGPEYFLTNIFQSNIIIVMNWNKFYDRFYLILPWISKIKKIIVWVSNDLRHNAKYVNPLVLYSDHIICANSTQKNLLLHHGFFEDKLTILPYWVDPSVFFPRGEPIEIRQVNKKRSIYIGSFQRDSLGSDLSQPKWQKGPDILIDFLKIINKFINIELIVAGPRRHYLINSLKSCGEITYSFCGDISYINNFMDDIIHNNLPDSRVAQLYRELDCYIVTSRSEGGPKAIIECLNSNCLVFSTDVGVARDLLGSDFIFTSADDLLYKLKNLETYKENFKIRSEYFRKKYNKNFYIQTLKELV